MANGFTSFGEGFARSFQTGQAINQRRREGEQRRQLAMIQQAVEAIESAKDSAREMNEKQLELASETFQRGGTVEQVGSAILPGIERTSRHVANLINEPVLQAIAAGELPADTPLPGDDFLAEQMTRAQAVLSLGQINQEAGDFSGINVEVTRDIPELGLKAGDPARAIQRETDQGIEFTINGVPVSGTDIRSQTQRTQEVTDFPLIPGTTEKGTETVVTALRESIGASRAFAQLANRFAADAKGRPEKLGTVGDIVRAFGSFTAQVEGIARIFGLDSPLEKEVDEYDFGSLASESAEIKRSILDLVFLDLASKGQTGRAVSDLDLKRFLEDSGISSGDPEQVVAGLRRGVENNQAQLREAIRIRGGGVVTEEMLAPDGLGEFVEPGTPDMRQQGLQAFDAALEANDLDRAEAIMEALRNNDPEALEALLNGQ